MSQHLAALPLETAQLLISLKADKENKDTFVAYVHELREAGWPLRAIAEPFGVSRAASNNWDKAYATQPATGLPVPAIPVTAHGQKFYPKKILPNIPPKDLENMRALAEQARKVNRWSPENSPERRAAGKLEEKLVYYTQNRKVPVARIARDLGLTRRAIAQRLEKYKD